MSGLLCQTLNAIRHCHSSKRERQCLFDLWNLIFIGGLLEVGVRATFSGQNVAQECRGTPLGNENGPTCCPRVLSVTRAIGVP